MSKEKSALPLQAGGIGAKGAPTFMKPIPLTPRQIQRQVRQARERTKKKAFKQAIRGANEPQGIRDRSPGRIPSLELYESESSGGSHAVRLRLTDLGLDYIAHTVPSNNALKREQLREAGGRDKIPFLVDRKTGVKLSGVGTILQYIEKQYGPTPESFVLQISKQLQATLQGRVDQISWAIRNPINQARIIADDMREGWKMLRESMMTIRDVIKEGAQMETAQGGASEMKKSPRKRAA